MYALDGLFPFVAKNGNHEGEEELATDYNAFENNYGVDDDPDAAKVIEGCVSRRFLKRLWTLAGNKAFVQDGPVLNKLATVIKENIDKDIHIVIRKVRLTRDNKESGVSLKAKRTLCSTLPRATHGRTLYKALWG